MKKRKFGVLACVGLGVLASAWGVFTTGATNIPTATTMASPFEFCTSIFHFCEQPSPAVETYNELSQEVCNKYNEQHKELFRSAQLEIEEAHTSILGSRHDELKTEIGALKDQCRELDENFYTSEQYTAFKAELDELIAELTDTEKGSEEYREIKEEINDVWQEISAAANEVRAEIISLRAQKAELKSELKSIFEQNKDALDMRLEEIGKQFMIDAEVINASLRYELDVLRQTLCM